MLSTWWLLLPSSKSCFLISGPHKVRVTLINESIDRDFIKNQKTAYTKNDSIEYTKNTTLNPEAERDVNPALFELLGSGTSQNR